MKNRGVWLGFALAFVFAINEMSGNLGTDVCFRDDVRPLLSPLLTCMATVKWVVGLLAIGLLGLSLYSEPEEGKERLWLPLSFVLWLIAYRGEFIVYCVLALWAAYLMLRTFQAGATWSRLAGLLGTAFLLELTHSEGSGPVSRLLFELCNPDPVRALVIASCLSLALLLLVGAVSRKSRALLFLSLVLAVPVVLWRPAALPTGKPDVVAARWESPYPSFQKDCRIVFPGRIAPPRSGFDSLQATAIAAGDVEMHRAVWDAVLAGNPLSLAVSKSELVTEHLLRPEVDGIKSFLTEQDIHEWGTGRVSLRARVKNGSWPARVPLRLVRSEDAAGRLNRAQNLSRLKQVLWLHRGRQGELVSSQHSVFARSDERGLVEFPLLPQGDYALLVGVGDREEVSSERAWMPMRLDEDRTEELSLSYSPLWSEPRNLDFKEPVQNAWTARYSKELEQGVVQDGETVRLIGGRDSYAGIFQEVDARPLRGKTLRVSMPILSHGRTLGYDSKPKVTLELRTSNSSFEYGRLKEEETPPAVAVATYKIDEDAERLSIRIWSIGLSDAVIGGLKFEVIDE